MAAGDPAFTHFIGSSWARPAAAPDSLVVRFTAGYVGVVVRARWHDGEWRGRVEAHTDVPPFLEATAMALLRQVSCS